MRRAKLLVMTALMACGGDNGEAGARRSSQTAVPGPNHGSATPGSEVAAVIVRNEAEAQAAIGKRVRVRGIAHRLKLGDTVSSPELSVVCRSPEFPREQIDREVIVEGVLSADDLSATVLPNGSITQGTGPGLTYTIAHCTRR